MRCVEIASWKYFRKPKKLLTTWQSAGIKSIAGILEDYVTEILGIWAKKDEDNNAHKVQCTSFFQ